MTPHHLTLDATHGVTEGLLLSALLDAGAPAPAARRDVERLGGGDVRMSWVRVVRGGAPALVADIRAPQETPPVGTWRQVRGVVEHVAVDDDVRDLALEAITLLVDAAAEIAGVGRDDLVLPEVSMLDHLAASVAIATSLVSLGVRSTSVIGPVPVGHGVHRPDLGPERELPDPVVVRLLERLPTAPGPGPDVLHTSRLGAAWLAALRAVAADLPHTGPPAAIGRGASHHASGQDAVLRAILTVPEPDLVS